jgi:hypothetical protein
MTSIIALLHNTITYVQLVELGLDAVRPILATSIRQQNLSDSINDSKLVGAEINREVSPIEFCSLAIRLVEHILATAAKGRWLAIAGELGELLICPVVSFLGRKMEARCLSRVPRRIPAQRQRRAPGSIDGADIAIGRLLVGVSYRRESTW